MRKIILMTMDKRTTTGYNTLEKSINSSEEIRSAISTIKRLRRKNTLMSISIHRDNVVNTINTDSQIDNFLHNMASELVNYRETEEKIKEINAYHKAITKVYEAYPDEEEDIEEFLFESSADNIFELAYILDGYMRSNLNDSIYRYMENKYIPEETYICMIWGNNRGDKKIIQVLDLCKQEYIYSKQYDICDCQSYCEYKEKLEYISNYGIKDFLSNYPKIIDFLGYGDCTIREYFF